MIKTKKIKAKNSALNEPVKTLWVDFPFLIFINLFK